MAPSTTDNSISSAAVESYSTPSDSTNEKITLQPEGPGFASTALSRTESTSEDDHTPRDATEEEIKSLRHVVDTIPRIVWVALMVGAAERFTYYGVSAPWRKSLAFFLLRIPPRAK